jgi:probable FeS assembly SUF system protein SufT
MTMREAVTLSRDVEAAAIPYGDKIPLAAGTTVFITQALGGSYTVMTERGYMVRFEGQDADAIGQPVGTAPASEVPSDRPLVDLAWDQLKTCYDPEIPVNIVDLGLVYKCEVDPLAEGGEKLTVHFTLTAPGCGMGDYLKQDVQQKIESLPGVKETDVQVVFDPPWEQSMMTEAARLQLGLM